MKRSKSLKSEKSKIKQSENTFFQFMSNILDKCFSEEVPPLLNLEECSYPPNFGVYHFEKLSQIRVVYDSTGQFNGCH